MAWGSLVNRPRVGVTGWPGTSNSMDICETLEDWTTDLSFISDSDEEDDVLLVRNISIEILNLLVLNLCIRSAV